MERDDLEVVYTNIAQECIRLLETEKFDVVLLDHDLDGCVYVETSYINTGSEVARWMSKTGYRGKVIVHSLNKPAADYMRSHIFGAVHIPFLWTHEVFSNVFTR